MRSDVVERAPDTPPLTRAGLVLRSLRVYEALAEAALQHVALGERDEALRMIGDALHMLDGVSDRRPFGRVLVGIAECLLDLGCADRAEPLLVEAVEHADALPDVRLGAGARRALGRAWLALANPSCRKILEEARTMFQRLGDRKGVLSTETLLREST